jgi:hypothetical protein
VANTGPSVDVSFTAAVQRRRVESLVLGALSFIIASTGQGPFSPENGTDTPPQIVYSPPFDCLCDVSYLKYIRCI